MTNFYGPLLGAARLYAYTRKQGHTVCFKDLNQNVFFTLLSRKYLERALERIQYSIDSISRNRFLREDMGAILLHSSDNAIRQLSIKGMLLDKPWYKLFKSTGILKKPLFSIAGSRITADNILYALLSEKDYILSEIEKSRQILDKGFFSLEPDKFVANFCTLLCGKAIIDAAYFPTQMDFGLGFYGTSYSPCTGDILRAVEDERYNLLIPYYRYEVLPLLDKEQPDIIGISITHMSEYVPAFTLAKLIKSARPEIHVTLGGAVVTEVSERISKNLFLWKMFDSLILGPGEYAFCELIERLETDGKLSAVPNLIYGESGYIKKSEKSNEFDINEACTPEFVSLRPKSSLPLEASSGCYWGKCIFCFYPKQGTASLTAEFQKKRVRSIELVINDIKKLRENYEPLTIGFTDSAIHPKRLEQIAEENLKSKSSVKFSAFIRFEKEFKSAAFCQKLAEGGFLGGQVGLESGSQHMNDIINKGVALEDAEVIIKNFYQKGILLHVYSIIGTPGETEEDAAMTYRFLKRWQPWLKMHWQLYPLYVLEKSPIAQRAAEFQIEAIPLPDDYLVESMLYRVSNGLSQEQSMNLVITYSEKLKRYKHPLNQIMDIESVKIFLLAQMAKGIPPDKIKKTGIVI